MPGGRLAFMSEGIIYLDNAATSWPKPASVVRAMSAFLESGAGSPHRGGHKLALAAGRVVREARVKLAKLLNASDPSRIVHCFNGTDALNVAIKGVLHEGDHAICTALDHNSVSRPLEGLRKRGVITLTRVPVGPDGCIDPDEVAAAVTLRTRLITVLHASNVTGTIQPVEAVGRIARERDVIFLLDAAQTAGVLNIDVEAWPVDLVAFPCHKALQGPQGTGALYVGPRAELTPFREGGTGADSDHPTQPEDLPTWLEAGIPNAAGLAGLSAALDELDPARNLQHERDLLGRVIDAFRDDDRVTLYCAPSLERSAGCLSFNIAGIGPDEVSAIFDESFGIAVRPGLHCAPYLHRALGTHPDGSVRIAPGPTTTVQQIDICISAIREIADEH